MSDAPSPTGAEAAVANLRETAKWLIGGVLATSAAVFAGSSLTRLGALDFSPAHAWRFSLAILGAAIGFFALARLMAHAIAVLRVERLNFRQLAVSQDPAVNATRKAIEKQFTGHLFGNATTLEKMSEAVDAAYNAYTSAPSQAKLKEFEEASAKVRQVMTAAQFVHVRRPFDELVDNLSLSCVLAIIGFGLFAWAANPPEAKPVSKPPFLQINLP